MKVTTKSIGMTRDEFQAYCANGGEIISDVEGNSIEWDGCFGKHWVSYGSEKGLNDALNNYEKEMVKFTLIYRHKKEQALKAKKAELKRLKELKTLGGQFPELRNLLVA